MFNPIFYGRYSRHDKNWESFKDVIERNKLELIRLGLDSNTSEEIGELIEAKKVFTSGRMLWCGGTDWANKPENYYGLYNCSSLNLDEVSVFGKLMNLSMQGCGTGANVILDCIKELPAVSNLLMIEIVGKPGDSKERKDETRYLAYSPLDIQPTNYEITVGDSRKGWVDAYQKVIDLAFDGESRQINIKVNLSNVRPAGEKLKGFGGTANPELLPGLFPRLAEILNGARGRRLTSVECILLIDEASAVVVAGGIRRTAGMRQGDAKDKLFETAKDNLWQQAPDGKWRIAPERAALTKANHTRVFQSKPTLEQITNSVKKQYYSGEGAIQNPVISLVRANCDLLNTPQKQQKFIKFYQTNIPTAKGYLEELLMERMVEEYKSPPSLLHIEPAFMDKEISHRMSRIGLNPCGEIIGINFMCNLTEVHLNNIKPNDYKDQERCFKAAALAAAPLLTHEFTDERLKSSRELDPIVGVSFTGLFDFFVKAFGIDWLRWMQAGRPEKWQLKGAGQTHYYLSDWFIAKESEYLSWWKKIVHDTVWEYCERNNLKPPNRCTTVQPAGTKSLLTGASPGWHPPFALSWIRRITFAANHPVALACMDYGYPIIPSDKDKDENGNLLDDPFDKRVTEWKVEIPAQVSWLTPEIEAEIDPNQFSALAQFELYMQVQKHYTTHNTSATIMIREHEIDEYSKRIHQAIENDEGYISVALLARFDNYKSFPRLPYEPISQQTYQQLTKEVMQRRKHIDFLKLLNQRSGISVNQSGPATCDSMSCFN